MLSPDAVLSLPAAALGLERIGDVLCFFKNRQYACWDVAEDTILPGYPRDIAADWPGLLEACPGRALRGVLHVPQWGPCIYFIFEGADEAIVWDPARRSVAAERVAATTLFPGALARGDCTIVAAELAGGERVIYGFKGFDYTRWTVGPAFPATEDSGYPRRIADDWKDGLVLAPRAGVCVEWVNRSTAHSNRKIYFFMGDLYLRWDVPSNTRNYRLDILAGWKGWPAFA
jgi:hypothetical protein